MMISNIDILAHLHPPKKSQCILPPAAGFTQLQLMEGSRKDPPLPQRQPREAKLLKASPPHRRLLSIGFPSGGIPKTSLRAAYFPGPDCWFDFWRWINFPKIKTEMCGPMPGNKHKWWIASTSCRIGAQNSPKISRLHVWSITYRSTDIDGPSLVQAWSVWVLSFEISFQMLGPLHNIPRFCLSWYINQKLVYSAQNGFVHIKNLQHLWSQRS